MCLSTNNRSTMSAGAPRRQRQRRVGWRFAKASYTVATIASSASTTSACFIEFSRRSLTSSAINQSPKLRCPRCSCTLQLPSPLGCGPFRTQQFMIELANALNRLLQFPIIVQPAAYLGNPFTPHAELTRASSWIGHSQNKHLMPFAACVFGAVFAVVDRTLQQRAAQQLAGYRQFADQLLARSQALLTNHSQE